MDEILKIVLERNKKRKVLNKNDIKRICEIIMGMYKCDPKYDVKFLKVSPDKDGSYGATFDDRVEFYLDTLATAQEIEYKYITTSYVLDGGKIDCYNFTTLEAIFHELAHVRQNMITDKGRNDLETKLFNNSYKLADINDFYKENYRNIPIEVDAFSRSLINSYKIYNSMPKDYLSESDKSVYAASAMSVLTNNYEINGLDEIITSPSELLLESAEVYNTKKLVNLDIDKFRELVKQKHDITIYKKLLLGLPLTYMEYAYVNLICDCVSHEQNVDFVKKLQKKL